MKFVTSTGRSVAALEYAATVIGGGTASSQRRGMSPTPLALTQGKGSRVYDDDGNSYIDYVAGWGPVILGHTHPEVTAAVIAQAQRGQVLGGINPIEAEAAASLLSALRWPDKVLFSNTGTEAVQVALRLARAATGRTKIVKMADAYHGWHDTVLFSYITDSDGTRPTARGRGQNPRAIDDVLVAEFNDVESLRTILKDHGDEVAAVLIDPAMTNAGVLAPHPDYLAAVRTLCHQHGALLIFDEVVTGFRTARGGAYELYGTAPDLGTYAKAIANGHSVSAVAGRAHLIDLVTDGVVHSGTYNANAIGAAAIIATQKALAAPGVYEELRRRTANLSTELSGILSQRDTGWTAHSLGGIVQLTPPVDRPKVGAWFHQLDWTIWARWVSQLVEAGLFLLPNGRLFVSTAHTDADIEATIKAFASIDMS